MTSTPPTHARNSNSPPFDRRRVQGWAVAQAAATVLWIGWNFLSNTGHVFPKTVGEVSAKYETSFTPAGYAFSIWGLIFLGLLALACFQLVLAFGPARLASARPDHTGDEHATWIVRIGPAFVAAQLVCSLWLVAWLSEAIWLSFALMGCLWLLLLWIVDRLNMERWDAPWSTIALCWWPLSLYFGWITAALLANLSSALASSAVAWVREPGWALGMASLLVLANLVFIAWRNMREFSMVGVWALIAVAVRHTGEGQFDSAGQFDSEGLLDSAGQFDQVAVGALVGAAVVVLSALVHGIRHFTWPRWK